MKIAAAYALADLIDERNLIQIILPMAFDKRVGKAVAEAVAEAARKAVQLEYRIYFEGS